MLNLTEPYLLYYAVGSRNFPLTRKSSLVCHSVNQAIKSGLISSSSDATIDSRSDSYSSCGTVGTCCRFCRNSATLPVRVAHRLNCIRSEIVLGERRLRLALTILPDILNSRSTPLPVAGTAKVSRAIRRRNGNIPPDSFHHISGLSILGTRLYLV